MRCCGAEDSNRIGDNADVVPETPLFGSPEVMPWKWVLGDHDGAAELARAAVPYIHCKRAFITTGIEKPEEAQNINDAGLARHLALL